MTDRLQRVWRGPAVLLLVARQQGVILGQGAPAAEVHIEHPAIMGKLWWQPSLAFGEAYSRGQIHVRGSLLALMEGIYRSWPDFSANWPLRAAGFLTGLPGAISRQRALANARHHYDLGNDFYRLWLDPSLSYSCAYYLQERDSLEQAQAQKLELLCRKLHLRVGQTLLDIGCGWGALLFHAACAHGVRALGITASEQQAQYVQQRIAELGLGERVGILRGDWRDLRGRFDRIVSVGMFEHVGLAQYAAFFRRWRQLLAPGGLSLLHTIGRMCPIEVDPWITRHIFPGGYLPSLCQITSHAAGAQLSVLDVENLRGHYARTLNHWSENYQAVRPQVVADHGESLARVWELYLQGAEAGFRWGDLQLWQIAFAADQDAPWPLNREVNLADTLPRDLPAS